MKIYIASSWKNEHAVVMLTRQLRGLGCEVLSFVENQHGEQQAGLALEDGKPLTFEDWCWSERGRHSFDYDTKAASTADLVIYLSPSGCDAWAEIGIAYASNKPIYGLMAKGEQVGLMRRLVTKWFYRVPDLIEQIFILNAKQLEELL